MSIFNHKQLNLCFVKYFIEYLKELYKFYKFFWRNSNKMKVDNKKCRKNIYKNFYKITKLTIWNIGYKFYNFLMFVLII
jgi:hypothetical protein